MLFCVLTDPLFPCKRTHMLHVRKLGEGFIQRGYHYKELKSVSEVENLTFCDILYVSNHFSCEPLHRIFAKQLWRKLSIQLARTKAKIILWSFHTVPDWDRLHMLESSVVHLGEDIYREYIDKEPLLHKFRDHFPVLSLKYASPLHPELSPLSDVERDLDFNFVGHGYRKDLTEHCAGKYRALIRNTPPTISEPLRVNSFRRAEINLVFHAPANVSKGIVVERYAEALSLGGIVFHDHPRISREFADVSSVIRVDTIDDIDREFKRVMALAPEKRQALRQQSFETWKTRGLSYFDQAGRIISSFG